MCRLKSAIILKDRVFCPEYDSHSTMLAELGIEENMRNVETLFVRAELSPVDGNIFSDIDTWQYKVYQNILPDWYVERYDRERMADAVKEWAKCHIFNGINDESLIGCGSYFLKNCRNFYLYGNSTAKLYGNSTAILYDNSTAKLYGNSTAELYGENTAELYGNSTAKLYGNSTATLYENSTVTLYENSTATLYENSTATLYDNSTATLQDYSIGILMDIFFSGKKENCNLKDNATLIDYKNKIIYQAGDWSFITIKQEDKPC